MADPVFTRPAGLRLRLGRRAKLGLLAAALAALAIGHTLRAPAAGDRVAGTVAAEMEQCVRERLSYGNREDRASARRFCVQILERREQRRFAPPPV